jgi:hypothetical protein
LVRGGRRARDAATASMTKCTRGMFRVQANGRRGVYVTSSLVIPFFCLCLRSVRLPSIYTAMQQRATAS